jgi:uncharacterized membrane protein YgcG
MRTFINSICLTVAVLFGMVTLATTATAATTDYYGRSLNPYQWETVGLHPCLGTDKCTDEWALNQAVKTGVFPASVAAKFRSQLADGIAPTDSQVCVEDQFFITFVKNLVARFTPYTVAAFSDGECRATKEWRATDPVTGWTYRYFTVLECGNKGGGIVEHLSDPVTAEPVHVAENNGIHNRYWGRSGNSANRGSGSGFYGGIGGGGGSTSTSTTNVVNLVDLVWINIHKDKIHHGPHGGVPPIPLPAALPLLLTALGGLALINRRRRTA